MFFCFSSLTHQEGLGALLPSEVTIEQVRNAKSSVELWVCYGKLIGYPPANTPKRANKEEVRGEIIEYLLSNGERFFKDKTDDWLKERLNITGPYDEHVRRGLVRKLRNQLNYTYENYQPTSWNARGVGEDVSMLQYQF